MTTCPAAFGWAINTNDAVWWPAFVFVRDAARLAADR